MVLSTGPGSHTAWVSRVNVDGGGGRGRRASIAPLYSVDCSSPRARGAHEGAWTPSLSKRALGLWVEGSSVVGQEETPMCCMGSGLPRWGTFRLLPASAIGIGMNTCGSF